MKSLQILLDKEPQRIYPGHGPVIEDGVSRINEYVKHRNEREAQVLELVSNYSKENNLNKPSTDYIVAKLYPGLAENVIPGAKHIIEQYLIKLTKEGKITM